MFKFVFLAIILLNITGFPVECRSYRIKREFNSGPTSDACVNSENEVSSKEILNVNGTEIKRGAYPWHVGIYSQKPGEHKRYICGGSIISENIVLSAASCFTSANGTINTVSRYFVAAGKLFSNWNALEDNNFVQKRNVSKIEIPKDIYLGYKSNYANDIAVLVVNEPFVLTHFIKPVCVDWNLEYVNEQLKDGIMGQVVGWGTLQPNIPRPSTFLKQLKFPFIELNQCLQTLPLAFKQYVTNDKYCAGYTNGTALCNGDSGNGKIFTKLQFGKNQYYIQGVVSVGPIEDGICDIYQLTVYTKVASHIEFIKRIVETNKIN